MNKIILIFAIVCISQVWSACNNELLTALSLPTTQNPYTTETGVRYCQALIGDNVPTCCKADTINTFQTKSDDIKKDLEAAVAKRDQYLIDTRKTVIPSIKKSLMRLQSAAAKASKLDLSNLFGSAAGDGGSIDIDVSELGSGFEEITDLLLNNYDKLKDDFITYQQSRATCMNTMINLQAAVWCLACDPSWESKGLNAEGQFTIALDTQTRVAGDCFTFLTLSAEQNNIVAIKIMAPMLDAMAKFMEVLASGNQKDILALFTGGGLDLDMGDSDITIPTDAWELPAQIEGECTATSCDWIWKHIFINKEGKQGKLNQDFLAAGGEPQSPLTEDTNTGGGGKDDTGIRLLKEGRKLADSIWTPKADEAKVTVEFSENPGNVDNTEKSAGLIKGAIVCALGLFMTLLF